MNYKYIASSMREGVEELEKIAALADSEKLTEGEFEAYLYAMLLDVFRAFNLRKSAMTKDDFDNATKPPKDIMKLFD